MGEKEFNTDEVEEEMSLSGQLSRRRRQRRMAEESNSSAVGEDEKMPIAPGMHRRRKVFLNRIMVLTGQNM